MYDPSLRYVGGRKYKIFRIISSEENNYFKGTVTNNCVFKVEIKFLKIHQEQSTNNNKDIDISNKQNHT